jgi:hypothetical protein
MPRWAAGVTTAPRKVAYLHDTLASLREAGWEKGDAPVIFAEPGSEIVQGYVTHKAGGQKRHGPWPNFLRALRTMIEERPAADTLAVFQDDILIAHGTKKWLERQLWPCPCPGVISLYTSAETAKDRKPGWFELTEDELPTRAYGALAVVMPVGAVRMLLEDPPGTGTLTRTDYWLGRFCLETGLGYRQHIPSLVRHAGLFSAVSDLAEGNPGKWTDARREGPCIMDVQQIDPLGGGGAPV